jgi:chemotaxis protein MotB
MAKVVAVSLGLVAAVVGALYFFMYRPQQEALASARREASFCAQEAAALKSRVADLEAIQADLQKASAELSARVQEKETELARLRATQDELLSELKQEIADGQIQVERLRDQIRVDLVDKILFDSGEATLKAEGVRVLERVGAVLKKADRDIEIQGHTDNVPIVGALAKRFPTNWELSAARAVNVARFLQDKAGLDPGRLSASGYSEYRPKASNETEEGRQLNRRIEILLVPGRASVEAGPR